MTGVSALLKEARLGKGSSYTVMKDLILSKTKKPGIISSKLLLALYLAGSIIAFGCAFIPSLSFLQSKTCFFICSGMSFGGLVMSTLTETE